MTVLGWMSNNILLLVAFVVIVVIGELLVQRKERTGPPTTVCKPVKFKQANKELLKPSSMTDQDCGSLWVYSDGEICLSCWRLSIWGRLKLLFTGHLWLWVWGGYTQPPVAVDINNPWDKEDSHGGT